MTDTVYKTYQTPSGNRYYRAWTDGVLWEDGARAQVHRLLELPFVREVAVMPDTHFGKGGPVGVAVQFDGALCPAVVGVDIGCGMLAALTDLRAGDLKPELLPDLRRALERFIPHGMTLGRDVGSWGDPPTDVRLAWTSELSEAYDTLMSRFESQSEWGLPIVGGRTPQHRDPLSQLGTLGTGNHFFEVSVDELDRVWCVVHSGSRGAGARIGDYFTRRAIELAAKWHSRLPGDDLNLAFLPIGEPEYDAYVEFMRWAQRYAAVSRKLMMQRALSAALPSVLGRYVLRDEEESFDIHHNYLDTSTLIARKGAVHLVPAGLAIIPGAMGARTYVVKGLPGLSRSLWTCSHGAGRAMSRTAAEKHVTLERHQRDLEGLECDKSEETLDETTSAYKDVDAVVHAQRDLVAPVHTLTAKVCVKGLKSKRK